MLALVRRNAVTRALVIGALAEAVERVNVHQRVREARVRTPRVEAHVALRVDRPQGQGEDERKHQ